MQHVQEQLEQLKLLHPLPEWLPTPQLFCEERKLGLLPVFLVGLFSQIDEVTLTGSAAHTDHFPIDRAYFELVERAVVWKASQLSEAQFPVRDLTGQTVGTMASNKVFPSSETPQRWRYSLSNGCAAHFVFREAALRAYAELIERDTLLRSWNGELPPQPLPAHPLLRSLEERYTVSTLGWSVGHNPQTIVCAVFAIPKMEGQGTLFGSASSIDRAEAIEKAARELVQAGGFLVGETFDPIAPPSPTAVFHQAWASGTEGREALRKWLRGERQAPRRNKKPAVAYSANQASYIDLGAIAAPAGKFSVVKATEEGALPLIFGVQDGAEIHPFS